MRLENIIKEIKDRGITAYKIAESTGLTEVGINKILNGTSKNPREKTLETLENYLQNKNNSLHNSLVKADYENEAEIFINKNGIRFFEYPNGTIKVEVKKVPFKAYASYLESYNDEEKLNLEFEKTTFTVDKIGRGNYLAFCVKNESMNGGGIDDTPDGAEVLGRELGRHLWTDGFHKSKYGFILLTKKAIYHKDIKNYNKEDGMLLLASRNPKDGNFEININDVYSIYHVIKRTF